MQNSLLYSEACLFKQVQEILFVLPSVNSLPFQFSIYSLVNIFD